MGDKVFEFAFALYQARQVDREMADAIVESAKVERITLEQATTALRVLVDQ